MSPVKSRREVPPFTATVISAIEEPRMCAARTKRNGKLRAELFYLAEVDRVKQREALLRLLHGVKREGRVVLGG